MRVVEIERIVAALKDSATDMAELGFWAEPVVYRRNGSDFDMEIVGEDRRRRIRADRELLARAMPDMTVQSVFHVDPVRQVILEITRVTGTTVDIPGSAEAGDVYSYATCDVYTVVDGRIVRIDAFDDAATSRQWSELMTHTRLLDA